MSVDRNRLELWRLRDGLDRRHRTGIGTIELEIALRGGRGAPGAMQGKRIARAACSGSDEYQVTTSGVLTRSSGAAASVGICNVWQI